MPCGKSKDSTFLADGLTKGRHYKFRVKAVNSEGASDPLETDSTIQAKNPFDRPGRPGKPTLTDWDKDHVDLEWAKPENDGGAPIETYQIEKRTKYGRYFFLLRCPSYSTAASDMCFGSILPVVVCLHTKPNVGRGHSTHYEQTSWQPTCCLLYALCATTPLPILHTAVSRIGQCVRLAALLFPL